MPRRGQALRVKFRVGGARFPQISGEHFASVDQECADFTQARRAGDRASAPHVKASSKDSTWRACCNKKRGQGIEDCVGPLGNGNMRLLVKHRHFTHNPVLSVIAFHGS